MIYITGDTHGETARFTLFQQQVNPSPDDMLIVAGDFGCIFRHNGSDESKLDELAKLPFTILFVDGNHECFPRINAFPQESWNGGQVHRVRPNILHLMRGQVFEVEGMKLFTMGGGYSLDKMFRQEGISWWPEELPNEQEYEQARVNLARHNHQVDVIISHAVPMDTMEMLKQMGVFQHLCMEEMPLSNFLENVRSEVQYRHWYFGHIHMDRPMWRNQTALYYDVYCLNTGEKVN